MVAAAPQLHVTNGTAVIEPLRAAGIGGDILSWDDVLHEGPVPAGCGQAALRDVRADFLATFSTAPGHPSRDQILRALTARDETLARAFDPTSSGAMESRRGVLSEVVLWFEHDLFDQLQLTQILDRFAVDHLNRLSLVQADDYLSLLPPAQLAQLFLERAPVSSAQHVAARDAWQAFTAPTPAPLLEVLPRLNVLPHLEAALKRHLEQFPSLETGVSRTEQHALAAIARGITRVGDLYQAAHQHQEAAIFMGDAAFFYHLSQLLRGSRPLLETRATIAASGILAADDEVTLTTAGQRVLDGAADRVTLSGIDRWLGGVHLTGSGPVWRWDRHRHTLHFA